MDQILTLMVSVISVVAALSLLPAVGPLGDFTKLTGRLLFSKMA